MSNTEDLRQVEFGSAVMVELIDDIALVVLVRDRADKDCPTAPGGHFATILRPRETTPRPLSLAVDQAANTGVPRRHGMTCVTTLPPSGDHR